MITQLMEQLERVEQAANRIKRHAGPDKDNLFNLEADFIKAELANIRRTLDDALFGRSYPR